VSLPLREAASYFFHSAYSTVRDRLAPTETRAHEADLDALLGSLEMIVPGI
jgi:hypothetical protein